MLFTQKNAGPSGVTLGGGELLPRRKMLRMLSIGTCNQIQDISQGKGVVMPIAFRKATILLLVLVLIVALGIVAVGCGGSEEDADTSGETTSDQTYKVTIMGASPGGLW